MNSDNSQPSTLNSQPIIYAYTRSQAVADGVQVDVTKTAQERESNSQCS